MKYISRQWQLHTRTQYQFTQLPGVQGTYCASIRNVDSAVPGNVYIHVCSKQGSS